MGILLRVIVTCLLLTVTEALVKKEILEDLWNDIGHSWEPWWETWHGMGACWNNKSFVFGIPDEVCHRIQCLNSLTNERIDLDKLIFADDPANILWKGDGNDCRPPRGGQIHIQKATTQEILLSYIFTLHNHDLTSAQAILEVFRTASEIGSAEFIIIDDASTEPMTITNRMINTLRAKFDTRIIIIHHNTSAGYTMSNNEGLRTATGTYAVLINSDLVVLPSWIALLFRTLFTFPGKVGMVGPLQISSSRKVQESGGIIFQDATPHNMFRGEDVRNMPFYHARIVDYISAACVLFNRTLFLDLGLFDLQYMPAYYEDTDAGMTFLQNGYNIVLQPLAVVIHAEGGSILSDEKERLMNRNKERFRSKHKNLLDRYCPYRDRCPKHLPVVQQHSLVTFHRQPNRILFMDSIPPEPDRDAGSIRSREILKILQSEGYSITFEPLGTGRHVKYALNLMADGINYVPHGTIKELSDSISHQEENFAALCGWEVIIVSRRVVFQENLSYIKRLCPKTPIIFDTIDLNFLREQRDFEEMVQRLKGSTLLDPFSKAAALQKVIEDRLTQSVHTPELSLMQVSDITIVVSETERSMIQAMSPNLNIEVVRNIYNAPSKLEESNFFTKSGALFVGSMCYPPNLNAVQFIVQEILGDRVFPEGFKMHIVMTKSKECKEYSRAASKVANKHPLIVMHKDVTSVDMRRLHKQVKAVVAPALFGAGVKGKINYALLHGVPVISTSLGTEGLHLEHNKSFVLANTADEFYIGIVGLYNDSNLWHRVRSGGLIVMQQWFSREVASQTLLKCLSQLKIKIDTTPWECPYWNSSGCHTTIKSNSRVVLIQESSSSSALQPLKKRESSSLLNPSKDDSSKTSSSSPDNGDFYPVQNVFNKAFVAV